MTTASRRDDLMPESQNIGKYRILERIARGGMGTIYKAHDPLLDRPVALKVISSEIDVTDELRGRFFREAQACARLSHPNIVIVYDMGEDDGRLFIVMELLDGEEMRRLIAEKRPMPLEDKLSIMRQVCEGLHYAHQRGVVHRDIKPGNLMRLRDGQMKILDFGIAQLTNAVDNLTRTGLIMGTLRYIAPEQVRGHADHRSDIYSVGAAFYELLSLRPPFDGDTAMQLLEQIRVEDPQPLDQVDPTIPADLASIVARAMRKDPDERFADLGQMRLGIEQVQRALSEEGRRVSDRLRTLRDRLERLDALVADRIGRARNPVPPASSEPRHLVALKALESDLAARADAEENTLRRADALDPALARARELLQAGEFTEAIAELETIVAEMPEHARAVEDLGQARAQSDIGRREQLAVQLLQDARATLRHRGYALCLEILKQADDVAPPDRVTQEIASLRQIAVEALSAQMLAEQAKERMAAARSSAEGKAAPLYAPVHWREAEAKAAEADAASTRGSYEEAGQAYDAAVIAFGLVEAAAREEQLRENSAKTTRDQALQCREAASAASAPNEARDLWSAANSRLTEGEAAVAERSFSRAVVVFEETAAMFRRAEQAARAIRQQQREQAEEARNSATKARQSAAEAAAEQLAPALWKVASSRLGAAELAFEKEQYDEAVQSFGRASLLYREAATEASEEHATVVDVTSPAIPGSRDATLVNAPETEGAVTIAAVTDSNTGPDAELPDVTATIVRIAPGDMAVADTSHATDSQVLKRPSERFEPPDGDELSRETARRRTTFSASGIAISLGGLAVIAAGFFWLSALRTPPSPRVSPQATQAPQVARPTAPDGDQAADRPGQPNPADEEPPKHLPDRPAPQALPGAAASAGDNQLDRPIPRPRSEKQGLENGSGQGRQAAERAGAATATARRAAERAAAAFYAPKLLASAESKEKDAAEALARSDFGMAIRMLTEAKSEYQAAEQEARREADAEGQLAPLKASVEQSRAMTVARRRQALAADAERLATTLLDAAEAKHAEADALAKRQSFAAARQAYDQASERYLEAEQRAQAASGTK